MLITMLVTTLIFISTLNLTFLNAKLFDQSELATELFEIHKIARKDIYKHICIANTLNTAHNSFYDGFIGIYRIGQQWWCGQESAGGGCNVKCSDLIDDNIADDVACASLILSQDGLEGWKRTENDSKILDSKIFVF